MKNFLNKLLSKEAATQQHSTPDHADQHPPVIISANDAHVYNAHGKLVLPVDNALLDADFARHGRDLMVQTDAEHRYLITNYYAQETLPTLVSETGKQVRGEAVKLLAGDPAANQYAGPVEGAAPIGSVEKLAGDVFVTRGGEEVKLEQGDPVFQNDVIRTEGDGSVGIGFVDGSVFSLGSDARMTLDSLVYDPSTGEGASEVTVLKGMFKFVSGDIAANNPGDMVVETPVATIGIRGTTGGGNVQGEGLENQFFLEPNADGTVGWFDVTTDAGTVSMNQPFMQVGINSISAPPPPPNFIDQQALNQQIQIVNNVLPNARYDNRPESGTQGNDGAAQQQQGQQEGVGESSQLLGLEGNQKEQQDAGEQGGEQPMDAGTTSEEGTNSDELMEAGSEEEVSQSGDENFDGHNNADDPTQNPIDQFVHKGDANEMLQAGKVSNETSQSQTQTASTQQPAPPPVQAATQHTPVTKAAPTTQTQKSSVDSYFQNTQDQVKVGNLPADTLNPTVKPAAPAPGGSTGGGTIGGGGTVTPPPANGGGTGTNPTAPALSLTAMDGSLNETLQGGSGADTFVVNDWAKYVNATATVANQADQLMGGAGSDKLHLQSHTSVFGSGEFNANNSGIDSIMFSDATVNNMDITISHEMIDQSDNDLLTLYLSGKTANVDASAVTDDSVYLEIHNGASVTMAGSAANVRLQDTSITHSGGNMDITLLGGTNGLNLSGMGEYKISIRDGNNTVTLGNGESYVEIMNGTSSVTGGDGDTTYFVSGGDGHTLTGGAGDEHFELGNASNNMSISGGAGYDSFVVRGGSGNTLDGGDGYDSFDIGGNANVVINEIYNGSGGNEYDFHSYSGTAYINVFSSVSAGADQLRIGDLRASGEINISLDNSNGTTTNAELDLMGHGFQGATYSAEGNALVMTMGSGGDIVFNDFFNDKRDYTLNLRHVNPYEAALNAHGDDTRDLSSTYAFTDVALSANALHVADGSAEVQVTMIGHGLQTGDSVTLSGFNGGEVFDNIVVGDVNNTFVITVIDANTFTYTMSHTYTATVPGEPATFGSAIKAAFESHIYEDIADFTNQTITGAAMQGHILGGGGNDTITGANDSHTTIIHGGDGNDMLTAGSNDVLKGGKGDDVLKKLAGAFNVTMYGGDSNDDGFDIVDYSNQSAAMNVDLRVDSQSGGDFLYDIEGVRGSAYADTIRGADGTSAYNYFDGGAGDDSIVGGTSGARNTVDYSWLTTAIDITLDGTGNASVAHAQAGNDTLVNIQNLIGGSAGDSLTGGSENNVFYGNDGNDTLEGGLGSDTLFGGAGNDVIRLGVGDSVDGTRDVVGFQATNNGLDSIYGFEVTPGVAGSAAQDALDITSLRHNANLHDMNYFEMLQKGYLAVAQNGSNTDIKVDINGEAAGGLTNIASLMNVNAGDIDWRHFITSDTGEYLVNTSGSSWEDNDDIIIAENGGSVWGYEGNDIIAVSGAYTGMTYDGGNGNDAIVIGNASLLADASSNVVQGGEGTDRLVLDFAGLDFTTVDMANVRNFEILDLYGNDATQLQSSDVYNMTDDQRSLFIESSKAGGSISLESTGFRLATAAEVQHLPVVHETDMTDYTTYVADYGGTEVYVHVNNSVTHSTV